MIFFYAKSLNRILLPIPTAAVLLDSASTPIQLCTFTMPTKETKRKGMTKANKNYFFKFTVEVYLKKLPKEEEDHQDATCQQPPSFHSLLRWIQSPLH